MFFWRPYNSIWIYQLGSSTSILYLLNYIYCIQLIYPNHLYLSDDSVCLLWLLPSHINCNHFSIFKLTTYQSKIVNFRKIFLKMRCNWVSNLDNNFDHLDFLNQPIIETYNIIIIFYHLHHLCFIICFNIFIIFSCFFLKWCIESKTKSMSTQPKL